MHVCLKMANNILVVFVAVFLLQIGTGKNIQWIKNSNWNNVDNWSLGRLPCKGDIASFSQVIPLSEQKPVIYFNANATVRKLMLPRNGRIVLKPSITIRLTANESCEISSDTVPMASASSGEMNNFVGIRANKWECPENWIADDNSSITHAPCGSDVAVFPSDSAFSYVTSEMGQISVRSVLLHDEQPSNFDSYGEFLLNLTVTAACQNNPALCPCITVDNNCSIVASTASPTRSLSATPTVASSVSSTVSSMSSSSVSLIVSSVSSSVSSNQPSVMKTVSSASTTVSSMPPPSLVISIPGNVGVTSTYDVPLPHTSGGIGPVASAGIAGNNDDSGSSITMIGAVIGVIVVLLIVVIIVVVIIIIVIRKRRYRETKHTHLEEDDRGYATKESGTAAYDNPAYECNISIHSTDQMENPLF